MLRATTIFKLADLFLCNIDSCTHSRVTYLLLKMSEEYTAEDVAKVTNSLIPTRSSQSKLFESCHPTVACFACFCFVNG